MRAHRRPLGLDALAEAGQPLGTTLLDHPVDDLRNGVLPCPQRQIAIACRELEVGDALAAETAPGGALGRHGLRGEDTATDEIEERGGELERAGFATLSEERWDERRLGVRRWLLLVLPVVAGVPFAAVQPEHGADDDEGRHHAEQKEVEGVAPRVLFCVVDPLAVLLERRGIGRLLGDDLLEARARDDPHSGGRGERGPGNQRSQLDELPRRHVQGAKEHALAGKRSVAADVHRVPPGAKDLARCRLARREAPERLFPFGAPDLEVDVDDVVVGNRDA